MVTKSGNNKGGKSSKKAASTSLSTSTTTTKASSSDSGDNKPRNHLILDATKPFLFTYKRFGVASTLITHQTAAEDTWPGGALWDLGVVLAEVIIRWTRGASCRGIQAAVAGGAGATKNITGGNSATNKLRSGGKKDAAKSKTNVNASTRARPTALSPGMLALLRYGDTIVWKETTVLELGCGVGLTGLVAAHMGAKLTILTDLKVVVEKVTETNIQANSDPGPNKLCGYRTTRTGGKVLSAPLCWGDKDDEQAVESLLQRFGTGAPGGSTAARPKRKQQRKPTNSLTGKGNNNDDNDNNSSSSNNKTADNNQQQRYPDLILIGDVAYQHRPGAPSHFEALISTLMKFVGPNTFVLFGTRMRMPASRDLLDMFREQLDEVAVVEAHEIDESFASLENNRKHNMSIHLFRWQQPNDNVPV